MKTTSKFNIAKNLWLPLLIWRKPSGKFFKRQDVKQNQCAIEPQCVKDSRSIRGNNTENSEKLRPTWDWSKNVSWANFTYFPLVILLKNSLKRTKGSLANKTAISSAGEDTPWEVRREPHSVIGAWKAEHGNGTLSETAKGKATRPSPEAAMAQTCTRDSARKLSTSELVNLQQSRPNEELNPSSLLPFDSRPSQM